MTTSIWKPMRKSRDIFLRNYKLSFGIEPKSSEYETEILPLYYDSNIYLSLQQLLFLTICN
jgi:hypothetical protein